MAIMKVFGAGVANAMSGTLLVLVTTPIWGGALLWVIGHVLPALNSFGDGWR